MTFFGSGQKRLTLHSRHDALAYFRPRYQIGHSEFQQLPILVRWIFHTPSILIFCRQHLDVTIKCSEIEQKESQWQRGSCWYFSVVITDFMRFIFYVLTEIKRNSCQWKPGGGVEKRNRIGCWTFRNVSSLFETAISCYVEPYVFQCCGQNIRNRSSLLGATNNPHKTA